MYGANPMREVSGIRNNSGHGQAWNQTFRLSSETTHRCMVSVGPRGHYHSNARESSILQTGILIIVYRLACFGAEWRVRAGLLLDTTEMIFSFILYGGRYCKRWLSVTCRLLTNSLTR